MNCTPLARASSVEGEAARPASELVTSTSSGALQEVSLHKLERVLGERASQFTTVVETRKARGRAAGFPLSFYILTILAFVCGMGASAVFYEVARPCVALNASEI